MQLLRSIRNIFISFILSFLVPLTSLLFLWDLNWDDAFISEIYFLLLVISGVTFCAYLFFLCIYENNFKKIELSTSTALFFLFFFGFVFDYNTRWYKYLYAKHLISFKVLIPLWAVAGLYALYDIKNSPQEKIRTLLSFKRTLFTILLICIGASVGYKAAAPNTLASSLAITEIPSFRPNIYYFILDAYPRGDTLKELYGYDNSPFLNELQKLGFFLCDKSCSNYSSTQTSLISTLNLSYLPFDKERALGLDYSVASYFEKNLAFKILKEWGYALYNISGGSFTAFHPKALNVHSGPFLVTQFSTVLLDKSWIGPFYAKLAEYELLPNKSAQNLRDQLQCLENTINSRFVKEKSPLFLFAHILSPHEPFFIGKSGSIELNRNLFSFKSHLESVEGISKRILKCIKNIIALDPACIIVLQSDHGSDIINLKKYITEYPLTPSDIKERMGNLNLIYLPQNLRKKINIPTNITSVNTFRLLFSLLSGKNAYPLLEEKIYFSIFGQWTNSPIKIFTPEEINQADFSRS